MRQAGREPIVVHRAAGRDDRAAQCADLLRRHRPDALVANGHAVAAAWQAQRLGMTVPDDLTIGAFSGEAANKELPLLLARVPQREVGEQAVDMLAMRLENPGEDAAARAVAYTDFWNEPDLTAFPTVTDSPTP